MFPLPAEKHHLLSGGFSEQEHVAIEVYPVDQRGHLGVQVRTATEWWKGSRPESQMKATIEIVTSYQPLLEFSGGLKRLLEGSIEEVLLEGEDPS